MSNINTWKNQKESPSYEEFVFDGSELKLNINIEPFGGVTMDDYDFNCDIYCNKSENVIHYKKSELVRVDENNYIALVDSTILGVGTIKCKVTAYVPDNDFDDGLRTEVIAINTGIKIRTTDIID